MPLPHHFSLPFIPVITQVGARAPKPKFFCPTRHWPDPGSTDVWGKQIEPRFVTLSRETVYVKNKGDIHEDIHNHLCK